VPILAVESTDATSVIAGSFSIADSKTFFSLECMYVERVVEEREDSCSLYRPSSLFLTWSHSLLSFLVVRKAT